MGHTFYQNYAHIAFHVNSVLLRPDDLKRVHAFMSEVLRKSGVRYVVVGGIENHVHVLGDFPVCKAASVIVRELKITTTMWLKQYRADYAAFGWQGGFGYRSIGAERYLGVKGYIIRQRQHHATKTYEDEISEMMLRPIPDEAQCCAAAFPRTSGGASDRAKGALNCTPPNGGCS